MNRLFGKLPLEYKQTTTPLSAEERDTKTDIPERPCYNMLLRAFWSKRAMYETLEKWQALPEGPSPERERLDRVGEASADATTSGEARAKTMVETEMLKWRGYTFPPSPSPSAPASPQPCDTEE